LEKKERWTMTTDAKTLTEKSGRYHLINYIAKEGVYLNLGNQEKAAKALEIVISGLIKVLQDHQMVRFVGFGTFLVQDKAASTGRNPRTGDTIEIAAYKRPVFRAGKDLKEALNPQRKPEKKADSKKAVAAKKPAKKK
jgi:DNA-binding protein HU-beta